MEHINEDVLTAWLRRSRVICNERLVTELPLNESLVCNAICRSLRQDPDRPITATWLCSELKMQKSLANRTLTSLEEKGIIIRSRSEDDKRNVFITFNHTETYEEQHGQILALVDTILEKIGKDKANDILTLFHLIADAADEVIEHKHPEVL